MLQSNLDPCLSIGDKLICIVYVHKLMFGERVELNIHDLAMKLFHLGVDIEQEEDASEFLEFVLESDEEIGLLKMKNLA